MDKTDIDSIRKSVKDLGPWFHNLHLPGGIQTAPTHFLGDFPARKWSQFASALPADLSGWKVLDIGCNAGFYSFELASRGATVLGIDSDPHYLRQARWAAEVLRISPAPEFRQMQVHELSRMEPICFDLVIFMGVFYHLRYPMLALDTVARLPRRLMIFQTLTMDSDQVDVPQDDYPIENRSIFEQKGWPKVAFVEKRFSGDPTNWWVPNHAGVEAMLRSTGFAQVNRVAHEIYLCTPPEGGVITRREWSLEEWWAATSQDAGLHSQGHQDECA